MSSFFLILLQERPLLSQPSLRSLLHHSDSRFLTIDQPLNQISSSEVETRHSRSLNIASRFSSSSQHTIATDAEYRSLPASPTLLQSNFSSPVHISDDTHQLIRSPLFQEGSSSPSPPTARPRLISFTPPESYFTSI